MTPTSNTQHCNVRTIEPVLAVTHAPSSSYGHPDDVLGDRTLSKAQKRAILASWLSDARAVENAPSLRQIDSGALVDVDATMRALQSLDRNAFGSAPSESKAAVGSAGSGFDAGAEPGSTFAQDAPDAGGPLTGRHAVKAGRSFARRKGTLHHWLHRAVRMGSSDDDRDPPPSPAFAAIPPRRRTADIDGPPVALPSFSTTMRSIVA